METQSWQSKHLGHTHDQQDPRTEQCLSSCPGGMMGKPAIGLSKSFSEGPALTMMQNKGVKILFYMNWFK